MLLSQVEQWSKTRRSLRASKVSPDASSSLAASLCLDSDDLDSKKEQLTRQATHALATNGESPLHTVRAAFDDVLQLEADFDLRTSTAELTLSEAQDLNISPYSSWRKLLPCLGLTAASFSASRVVLISRKPSHRLIVFHRT